MVNGMNKDLTWLTYDHKPNGQVMNLSKKGQIDIIWDKRLDG